MVQARNIALVILACVLVSSACAKKSTRPEPEYKEPLSFDIFRLFPDMPVDSNYVRRVYEAWDNELKDDATLKNHTWLVGDYTVFVYHHGYIAGTVGTGYYEVIFFTTTKPKKGTDKVHSTITPFEADFLDTSKAFSKIQTYVYVDKYRPIMGGEETAINLMLEYLDEFIERYEDVAYDSYLINSLKKALQQDNYLWEWGDHYVYWRSPHDFGGAIIVNKLTSQLDYLGSSVWMGHGKRYFPVDDSTQ
ncbi:MAG: hypothetical protein GTO24_23215 [candidate division Zixibacteria bacterium]|nr:hypothetical protein [candidate division Zixibacteria bacterium]